MSQTSVKVTLAWVGNWGTYEGPNGEDKHLLYAAGVVCGSEEVVKFRVYDQGKRPFFVVNSTIRLQNIKGDTASGNSNSFVVNEHSRVFRCVLVPCTPAKVQEATLLGMPPNTRIGNLSVNKEVNVTGIISSIEAVREVNIGGQRQASVRNLVLTQDGHTVEVALWRKAATQIPDTIVACGHHIVINHTKVTFSNFKKRLCLNVNCPEWVQLGVVNLTAQELSGVIIEGVGDEDENKLELCVTTTNGTLEVTCRLGLLRNFLGLEDGAEYGPQVLATLPLTVNLTVTNNDVDSISF